jgi:hypothetical protein
MHLTSIRDLTMYQNDNSAKHIDEWAEHVSTEVGGAYLNIKVAGRYGDR